MGRTSVAAEVAKEAGVGSVGLIHINPSYDEPRCSAMLEESRTVFASTVMPEDGVPIPLQAAR